MNKKLLVAGGFFAGICTGLFGTGGGILALPVLYRSLEDTKAAHRIVMLFILPLTLLCLPFYIKNNTVDWPIALQIGMGGIPGALAGAVLLGRLPEKWLKGLFSLIIIYTGLRMLLT